MDYALVQRSRQRYAYIAMLREQQGLTFAAIGRDMGLSTQRVKQLYDKAQRLKVKPPRAHALTSASAYALIWRSRLRKSWAVPTIRVEPALDAARA